MLKISCSRQDSFLNSDNINRFFCQHISKIIELWLKYSNGRFGFSVQRQIWLKLDCDWIKVGVRLGWRVNNRWKEYSELTFSIHAPKGAFPTFWGGEGRKLIFGYSY
jgi:eukaryotic-like serine/threonine-protein kinase